MVLNVFAAAVSCVQQPAASVLGAPLKHCAAVEMMEAIVHELQRTVIWIGLQSVNFLCSVRRLRTHLLSFSGHFDYCRYHGKMTPKAQLVTGVRKIDLRSMLSHWPHCLLKELWLWGRKSHRCLHLDGRNLKLEEMKVAKKTCPHMLSLPRELGVDGNVP